MFLCDRAEADGIRPASGEHAAEEDDSHGKIITCLLHNILKGSLIRVPYTLHRNVHSSMHQKI